MRYLLILLLAGCTAFSLEDQDRIRKIAADDDAKLAASNREREFRRLEGQCLAYGFKSGTPEISHCMMQIDQAAKNRPGGTVCTRVGYSVICN